MPGCAIGEEIYSIAICIEELLQRTGDRTPVQLFGTDISDRALQRAWKGIYAQSITADMSPERLSRYFLRVDSGYLAARANAVATHCRQIRALLDDESRKYLGFIQSGAERMSELIRDLLAYSQIHTHEVQPEPGCAETLPPGHS